MSSEQTPATTSEAPPLADRITRDEPQATAPANTDGAADNTNGSGLAEPEYDVEVTLNDLQSRPDNALYSTQSFEELQLRKEILDGLYSMNFRKPSKIQERALPLLLMNPPQNLIGQSQSGTGKTAAFTLNMLSRVDTSIPVPQALVLAPSRELARQTMGVVQTMGSFIPNLSVFPAVPDPSRRNQKVQGQIVVGTPGTVTDLIRRKHMDVSQMQILVLDEADNMLDQQGLGDQCKRVKMLLPKSVQVVLFSATFPEQVLIYADMFAPNANKLTLKHEELTVEGIKQFYFDCDDDEHKYKVLVKFYGLMTISSSIIFVKRRDTAVEIERRMTADGHQVAQLSGGLEGPERDRIIDKFRKGEAKVLITTNVLSRGIDVQTVTMVINYDIPETVGGRPDPETYLHRIGRTGRFGRVGVAISFVSGYMAWQQLDAICKHFNVHPEALPTNDWDKVEEIIKKVIKSGRAGKSTADMMAMDGSAS